MADKRPKEAYHCEKCNNKVELELWRTCSNLTFTELEVDLIVSRIQSREKRNCDNYFEFIMNNRQQPPSFRVS